MEKELTIIYYTANKLNSFFAKKAREVLKEAAGNIPIISISQKPLKFGENFCVGDIGQSFINIYKQMIIGAQKAKTKYVAMAEDDVLYHREHFVSYTPKDNEFAYDMTKWSLYTWTKPPIYSFKNRRSNTMMICPRDLLIETLEERFEKFPEGSNYPPNVYSEPGKYERLFGLTPRTSTQFWSHAPSIVFSHEEALGYGVQGRKKALGELRAYDVPYWGKASDVIKKYYGKTR